MQSTDNTPTISEAKFKSGPSNELTAKSALCDDAYLEKQQAENFPDLSDQLRAFAQEYVTNGYKHREAAIEVGRAASGALKLVRNPLVCAYVRYLQDIRVDSSYVTKDFMDAKLEELQDMAMGEADIAVVLADGTETQAKKFQGELALKVLQKRGELSGAAKPAETGQGGSVSVHIDVGALLGASNGKIVSEQ